MTKATNQPSPAVSKAEVVALLDSVTIAGLRRIKKMIEKKHTARPRTSECTPRREPLSNWKPKDQQLAASAVKLIKSGVSIKCAPYTVTSDGWQHKFFAADVAQRLVHDEHHGKIDDERSLIAKSSIAVATLTARIVEEANALKASDAALCNARLEMQNSRQDAGWSKATTRGSGVVMNDEGRDLLLRAAGRVAERVDA